MAMEEQNTSTDESDACESEGQDSASIGPRETKLEHVLDDLESFDWPVLQFQRKLVQHQRRSPRLQKVSSIRNHRERKIDLGECGMTMAMECLL
ncbi:hypothetical protein HPP92_017121 [Vanilla planifolia]|uniref:Uncharacterized protein n=1 Tax=Vanilla planifolia TaxID=51239 RepID=A0A835QFG4_VANPL|nr:hypothetical protein HPP92_017121 [Vanilla planifolia]